MRRLAELAAVDAAAVLLMYASGDLPASQVWAHLLTVSRCLELAHDRQELRGPAGPQAGGHEGGHADDCRPATSEAPPSTAPSFEPAPLLPDGLSGAAPLAIAVSP